MSVSAHVIDCMYGKPTVGMSVRLDRDLDGAWIEEKRSKTDDDGRIRDWLSSPLARGTYQLEFDLDGYFSSLGIMPFYPLVTITFRVLDPAHLIDISLLITPYAYFTFQQNDIRAMPILGAVASLFGAQNGMHSAEPRNREAM